MMLVLSVVIRSSAREAYLDKNQLDFQE